MAPKLAAMDTWRPHATVRIGLAVPGRPIGPWSRRTGAPQTSATGRDRTTYWSALGPHEVGNPGFSAGTSGHNG
jgi:hypothetical protein